MRRDALLQGRAGLFCRRRRVAGVQSIPGPSIVRVGRLTESRLSARQQCSRSSCKPLHEGWARSAKTGNSPKNTSDDAVPAKGGRQTVSRKLPPWCVATKCPSCVSHSRPTNTHACQLRRAGVGLFRHLDLWRDAGVRFPTADQSSSMWSVERHARMSLNSSGMSAATREAVGF